MADPRPPIKNIIDENFFAAIDAGLPESKRPEQRLLPADWRQAAKDLSDKIATQIQNAGATMNNAERERGLSLFGLASTLLDDTEELEGTGLEETPPIEEALDQAAASRPQPLLPPDAEKNSEKKLAAPPPEAPRAVSPELPELADSPSPTIRRPAAPEPLAERTAPSSSGGAAPDQAAKRAPANQPTKPTGSRFPARPAQGRGARRAPHIPELGQQPASGRPEDIMPFEPGSDEALEELEEAEQGRIPSPTTEGSPDGRLEPEVQPEEIPSAPAEEEPVEAPKKQPWDMQGSADESNRSAEESPAPAKTADRADETALEGGPPDSVSADQQNAAALQRQRRQNQLEQLRQGSFDPDEFLKQEKLDIDRQTLGDPKKIGAAKIGQKIGSNLRQRIQTGDFRAYRMALTIALMKDGWDMVETFLDAGIMASFLNILISGALYGLLFGQSGWIKQMIQKYYYQRVIGAILLEFIPGLSFIPVYTLLIMSLKRNADKDIKKHAAMLKRLQASMQENQKQSAQVTPLRRPRPIAANGISQKAA